MANTARRSPINSAWLFTLALSAIISLSGVAAAAAPAGRPLNVLFIAVDDLRPQLGCYGHTEMMTPHLDELAAQGRRFEHHYVQVPTCGASRCAMLTGRYPQTPASYDNGAFEETAWQDLDRPVSMPDLFRREGYQTVSIGKITHSPDGKLANGAAELPFSWDETGVPAGKWNDAWGAFFAYADGSTRIPGKTPATERADVPDDGYPDGLIADAAMKKLAELKDEPFFLAVGFFKPHLPFNAPARYWDLYDADRLPLAANPTPPKNVDPAISLHKSGELTPRYTGLAQRGVVTEPEARRLRHAYSACVSYADAQVGRVLDELDRLGLRENTIVVVWGDHGWHLGEHGVWGKHTLHERALHSPLLVRVPGMAAPGEAAAGIVETVDLYPTLAELCGLSAPADLDGASFAPLLRDPQAAGKPAAYGFWARGRAHTVRTRQHRLTQWTAHGDPSRVAQIELYDHRTDPNETVNIAAAHPDVVKTLAAQLRSQAPLLIERAAAAAPQN